MKLLVFAVLLILADLQRINYAKKVICGPNQEYDTCLDVCPLTCENYQNPPRCSPGIVCNEGCQCKEGYVWLNDVCVPINECPSIGWPMLCTVNRTYQYRGIHVKTCDNVDLYPTDPGCYCRKGCYLDRNTGECVLNVDCPTEYNCFENEELSHCKPSWLPTCAFPHLGACYPITPTLCEKACVCKDGFVWDSESGTCVRPRKCSAHRCPRPYEIYKECGSACEPVCGERPVACVKRCVEGCFCKPGYIRESKGGRCIPTCDCEKLLSG